MALFVVGNANDIGGNSDGRDLWGVKVSDDSELGEDEAGRPALLVFEEAAPPRQVEALSFRETLAYHWAPIWYQDIDATADDGTCGDDISLPALCDYITRFDYDSDWVGINNWENLADTDNRNLSASVYYSVVETETNWFIGYYDFHPRDWDDEDDTDDEHENDMEGALIVVQKSSDEVYGKFLAMITQAHGDFYQYRDDEVGPSSNVTDDHDDIDGDLDFSPCEIQGCLGTSHPTLFVEAEGHGVFAGEVWQNCEDFPPPFPSGPNDHIVYYPTGISEAPRIAGNPEICRDKVGYSLIDIQVLWERRFGLGDGDKTFERFGVFDGDEGECCDKAGAPWGWDDRDDGPTFTGEMHYDPANLVSSHLNGLGPFDLRYTYNPYAVGVTIDEYQVVWDRDADVNDFSDAYLNLYLKDGEDRTVEALGCCPVEESAEVEKRIHWIGFDMPPGGEILGGELPRNHFYGVRTSPDSPYFGVRSRDFDDFSLFEPLADWLMGSQDGAEFNEDEFTHWYGPSPFDGAISAGQTLYEWGGSAARITVTGDIIEDDGDSDSDGLRDPVEVALLGTECPLDPSNRDTDGDGLSDGEDDCDGDGLTNAEESNIYGTALSDPDTDDDELTDGGEVDVYSTNPADNDTDDDRLPDGREVLGSNPTDPTSPDTDGDSLRDGLEDSSLNGALDTGETDPNNPDTDSDLLLDGCEVLGSNPTDPLNPDSDSDELTDGQEDFNQNCAMDPGETDPNNLDTDGDGLPDGEDVEWLQDAVSDLPRAAFKDSGDGLLTSMLAMLDAVEARIAEGDVAQAVRILEKLITRVDGCGISADANDWIVVCSSQVTIRESLDILITNLSS